MALDRRSCALALVLAMLAAMPLGAPRGCVDCPPGCPMHARRDAGEAQPAHRLGCHRGPAVPTGEVCLRSACGNDAAERSQSGVQGILHPPLHLPVTLATREIRVDDLATASISSPEPPTDPPRSASV